jgi:predicted site-specific integrase-resolvase|tara:strand:+ start:1209 stop:1661 length:453 start_codon:yes stop_codon:yes gene_type:complete
MAILSLREAAQAANVARQTIYRYAKSGKLSTVIRDDGTKGVDTSELIRVFGKLRDPETVTEVSKSDNGDSHQKPVLQGELEATKRALAIAEASLSQFVERESRLLKLIESQTLLLEHQQPTASVEVRKKDIKGASKKKLKRLLMRAIGKK